MHLAPDLEWIISMGSLAADMLRVDVVEEESGRRKRRRSVVILDLVYGSISYYSHVGNLLHPFLMEFFVFIC